MAGVRCYSPPLSRSVQVCQVTTFFRYRSHHQQQAHHHSSSAHPAWPEEDKIIREKADNGEIRHTQLLIVDW